MKKEKLVSLIKERKSFLCVGLDPDMSKIPAHLHGEEDPIFAFNKAIIDATRDYCVAYKPNMAFYECHGLAGWKALEKTINYIGKSHFIIADAKRGDIGNTATMYAKAFFEAMPSDSITVAPYMGADSVTPFLAFEDKWAIVLALTSNKGADDFQFSQFDEGAEHLYEQVVRKSSAWGTDQNMMYVVGATRPEFIESIRKIVPNHFFLVPGVGAQGGNLRAVADSGLNSEVGLLVNSSRGILYAGKGEDFAQKSAEAAKAIALEMSQILDEKSVF